MTAILAAPHQEPPTMRHLLSIILVLVAGFVAAAEQGTQPGQMPDMTLAQPGPEHQALAKLAGTWDVAAKMWMEPGKDPMESKGTAKMEVILDGRYLRQDYRGDFMGQPFTGIGIEGFDRVKNAYTSTWLDSMSTGIMHMDGTSSDGGKTITYEGDYSCPMEKRQIQGRTVTKIIDDKTFTVTMYATREGSEAKTMELRYTRAK
jgi:hypothetical protein